VAHGLECDRVGIALFVGQLRVEGLELNVDASGTRVGILAGIKAEARGDLAGIRALDGLTETRDGRMQLLSDVPLDVHQKRPLRVEDLVGVVGSGCGRGRVALTDDVLDRVVLVGGIALGLEA